MDDSEITKRRVEACVTQALMNAKTHGGDNATAAADLACAFVLLSVGSGADPDKAHTAMWDHAKACVGDFWPNGQFH